ncbi:hypothetical protein, partial [Salmonella sp. s51228]|uniref:hypothetical protein n=1 Tax=Salmonella sp. s51228 TaxID=3159652 RepID=UPI00397EA5BE
DLFENGIIASNNFSELIIALKNIQRSDLIEILENKLETQQKQYVPDNKKLLWKAEFDEYKLKKEGITNMDLTT